MRRLRPLARAVAALTLVLVATLAAVGVLAARHDATSAGEPAAVAAVPTAAAGARPVLRDRELLADRTPRPSPTPEPAIPAARAHQARPVAPAHAWSPTEIRAIITAAAQRYGVSAPWMIGIASCESGLNPAAVEPHGHFGLFQFLPSTFYGNGGHDLWDPADQAAVAARMLAGGQAHQWACA